MPRDIIPADNKPIWWISGETFQSPPFGEAARSRAGWLLRRLQRGEALGLPISRPLPQVGPRCHELRVADPEAGKHWRIFYRTDPAAILVVHVYDKDEQRLPARVIALCQRRLREYGDA